MKSNARILLTNFACTFAGAGGVYWSQHDWFGMMISFGIALVLVAVAIIIMLLE